jgi:CIC family chloride channel protein
MTTGAAASRSDEPVGSGFDLLPRRPVAVTIVLFVVVVTGAAVFAHVFRETTLIALDWLTDADGPVAAAQTLHPVALCALVTGSVAIAAVVGLAVDRRWRSYVGVEAVAASARGEARRISLRASALRAAATWLMSMGAVSVGRESAIIETAGAAGSVSARRLGGKGHAMAAAGIAAAFAAAYHAPVAALLYVEEHLGVRRSRRAVLFALAGALGGQLATVWLFDVHPIFPRVQGSRWQVVAPALVALVPSVLAARLFLQLRVRLNGRAISDRFGVHRGFVVAGFSLVAGVAVAVFPLAAGNGMEGLRSGATQATVSLAIALSVGKLIATTATLASGAPGGVLSPSMGIAGGVGLLVVLAARDLGLTVDHPWNAMVACMAIGVAVGLRAPLVAIVLIPEMLGDYALIPVIALVVGVAVVVDRGLTLAIDRFGAVVPGGVYDEDA